MLFGDTRRDAFASRHVWLDARMPEHPKDGSVTGMRASLARLLLLTGLLAVSTSMIGIMEPGKGVAQGEVTLGVDADPNGNAATSLGAIDSCVSVSKDDTFQVDVFITDVTDLLAWEVYFSFDGDVINVVDRDVKMFQAANAGSDVFDASDQLPSSGGLYRLGAIDISQPPAPDSGSGVLARLTLKAVGAGLSPAILATIDANNDGKIDLGPLVSGTGAKPIGDANADGLFDGPLVSAQIAVDRDCPAQPTGTPRITTTPPAASPTEQPTSAAPTPVATVTTQTASPGPSTTASPATTASPTAVANPGSTDDDGSAWTSGAAIIGYVAAGLGALLLASIGFLSFRKGRAR